MSLMYLYRFLYETKYDGWEESILLEHRARGTYLSHCRRTGIHARLYSHEPIVTLTSTDISLLRTRIELHKHVFLI